MTRGRFRSGHEGHGRNRPRRHAGARTRVVVLLATVATVATVLAACEAATDGVRTGPSTATSPSGSPSTSTSPSRSAASSTPPGGSSAPTPAGWRVVRLPDASEPQTVTTAARGVVVGSYASARPDPRLWLLPGGPDDTGSPVGARRITLTPLSPYAFEARWLAVAADGDRLLAVGGARGGAHSNVRWTVWAGTTGAVREQPQPFEVFGGWGAGDLSGAAFVGGVPVVSGGWQSERTGNDVSLWHLSGQRWNRGDSTGTPLGSTPAAINGARSLTADASGAVLAGSVTDLAPDGVRTVPAVWTATSGNGPWTLTRLPARSALAEAHAATCRRGRCVVVGQDEERLAVWTVEAGVVAREAVPAVALGQHDQLPPPVVAGDRVVVVAPGTLLERGEDGRGAWVPRPAPGGSPVSATVRGGALYVVEQDAASTRRLFVGHIG